MVTELSGLLGVTILQSSVLSLWYIQVGFWLRALCSMSLIGYFLDFLSGSVVWGGILYGFLPDRPGHYGLLGIPVSLIIPSKGKVGSSVSPLW